MAGLPIAVGVGDPSGHAILLIQSHYSHPVRGAPASILTRREREERRPTVPADRPTYSGRRTPSGGLPTCSATDRPSTVGLQESVQSSAPHAVTGCIPCSEVIKYGH